MSYPVNRCPLCGQEIESPLVPTVDTAIEKEKELWRPYDCDLPEYYTWTEGHVDSSTATDYPDMPYTLTVT